MLGVLGPVTFEASSFMVRTWHQFQRRRKARHATHDVLDSRQVLQFLGWDLDSATLAMRFASDVLVPMGLDPRMELETLGRLLSSGEAYILAVGTWPLGRFVVESVDETWKRTDGFGRLTAAEVSVKLREYA